MAANLNFTQQSAGIAVDYLIEQVFNRLKKSLDPSKTLGIPETDQEESEEEDQANQTVTRQKCE